MLACGAIESMTPQALWLLNGIIHTLATAHHQGNVDSKWQISIDRIKIVDGNERLFLVISVKVTVYSPP